MKCDFDASQSREVCQQCASQANFNLIDGKCVPKPKIICPKGAVLDTQLQICICAKGLVLQDAIVKETNQKIQICAPPIN
jgi:hypothetical protein